MPVVTPYFGCASTETVNAVRMKSSLRSVICGRSSASARSGDIGTQINPRACTAMKLIISGETCAAAPIKSPSFSRFSSSATMTSLPWRMSSMASSTRSNGMASSFFHVLDDELADHVAFEIHRTARLQLRKIRVLPGVRDDGHLDGIRLRNIVHGQTDSVHSDRSM